MKYGIGIIIGFFLGFIVTKIALVVAEPIELETMKMKNPVFDRQKK